MQRNTKIGIAALAGAALLAGSATVAMPGGGFSRGSGSTSQGSHVMGGGMGGMGGMGGGMGGSRMSGSRGMDVDRRFIEQMIPHHDDAVAMAKLAPSQAEHPELRGLAERIKRSQTVEIKDMRGWYRAWYGTKVPPSRAAGMMHGMASDPSALDGAESFDKAFIEAMVPHHQMAVMMATMALRGADRPDLRKLLRSIVRTQSAEIELMRQWYQQWYGEQLPSSHSGMHSGIMGRNR